MACPMFKLDPTSLIFTNGLLSLVVTVVLLVSRIGMGEAARGVRTWVVADIFFAAARGMAVVELLHPGFGVFTGLGFPVLTGSLAMIGLVGHLHALERVAGGDAPPSRVALQALGLVLLYALPAASMASVSARVQWMDALLLLMAALTLRACWPLRRLWGARLIAAMMALAIVFQGVRFIAPVFGIAVSDAQLDLPVPQLSVEPLLIDLVIALFLSAGFMLLLQERLRQRIERLVVTDALTGVLNRHGLVGPLERELAQAARHGRPLSVVIFDLDHFKRVNDQHGHAVGDAVLAGFAARVTTLMRGGDLFGRWGGEEFLLILPDTEPVDALGVADRIRTAMAHMPVVDGAPSVTVSGGIACAAEVRGVAQALLKLLELADQRLYLAKHQRNQIVAAPA